MHSRASCPGKREAFAVWNSGKLGIKFISPLAKEWGSPGLAKICETSLSN